MRPSEWMKLVGGLGLLGSILLPLTAAGRLYVRGRSEEAGRKSRQSGILALSAGSLALGAIVSLRDVASARSLFWSGCAAGAVAVFAAGLGGLSRKPVPSVYVAWIAYVAAALLIVAARSC